jgi:hypothetical protein
MALLRPNTTQPPLQVPHAQEVPDGPCIAFVDDPAGVPMDDRLPDALADVQLSRGEQGVSAP